MDEINKFLLAGDKVMPEMHLRQASHTANILGFTYCACGPFTKSKERIQKFRKTQDSRYNYWNEADKASFSMILLMGTLKT